MELAEIVFAGALVLMCGSAQAQTLGVSPGNQNLGTVERGETVSSRMYLVTSSDARFLLRPSVSRADSYDYGFEGYDMEEVSRESFSDWIDFQAAGQPIDPGDKVRAGEATFEGAVNYSLSVPRDAEPGWHVGRIRLSPRFPSEVEGSAVSLRATIQPVIAFKVPGEVRRDFEVESSQAFRIAPNRALGTITVRNTGTVTSVLDTGTLNVTGPQGYTETGTNTQYRLSPGERTRMKVYWSNSPLPAGNYDAQGSLPHMTGAAFVDTSFTVTDFVNENVDITDPEGNQTGLAGETGGTSTWLIVGVLVLLGVLMYSFEIDPVWIIALLGALGVAAVVLTTPLPNALAAVAVVLVAVVMYVL